MGGMNGGRFKNRGPSSFGMFLCRMDRDLNAKYSPWGNELYGGCEPLKPADEER